MQAVLYILQPAVSESNPGWVQYAAAVAALGKRLGVETQAAQNVWLLSLPDQTSEFTSIVQAAERNALPYRVLYFEEDPKRFGWDPK